MKCLRCGYCCIHYDVIIVDEPSKGLRQSNLKHKPCGEKCQHLLGNTPGNYACNVHHYKWYKRTPCYSHSQIEQGDTNCRLGEFMLKKGMNHEQKGIS